MTSLEKHPITLIILLCGLVAFLAYDSSPSVATAQVVESPVIVMTRDTALAAQAAPQGKYEYMEITNSCSPYFKGHCIPVYSGPGVEYAKLSELRNGMILKVKSKEGSDGQMWYRIYFDEWLRHPERVEGDWYIPAVAGRSVTDDGVEMLSTSTRVTSKRIVVNISDHMLYAYDGDKEFMVTKVSTGLDSTPTPLGTFAIYKKTPSRYMQGPIPGVNNNPFDLPGVPWNLYFTKDGAVIHGSYWHDRYGTDQSSGCINLPPELAKILYDWAEVGTTVTVNR